MYGDERGLAPHLGRGIVRFNFWRFEIDALIAIDKSISSLLVLLPHFPESP